jgi:hypothetical protein
LLSEIITGITQVRSRALGVRFSLALPSGDPFREIRGIHGGFLLITGHDFHELARLRTLLRVKGRRLNGLPLVIAHRSPRSLRLCGEKGVSVIIRRSAKAKYSKEPGIPWNLP